MAGHNIYANLSVA